MNITYKFKVVRCDIMNYFTITINDNRYNYQCEVFQKYGLEKPTKFTGLKFEPTTEMGCLYSHITLLMMCRHLNLPYYFCFEEDAYPRKDVVDKINFYVNNKPNDCGILCLGRNGHFGSTVECGHYYIINERPFGAHAYIVYKECYDELLESFEKQRIADIALRGYNFTKYKPYWTRDYLFIQKNIDNECMSRNFADKGKYFYPDKNDNLYCSNELPNKYFE